MQDVMFDQALLPGVFSQEMNVLGLASGIYHIVVRGSGWVNDLLFEKQ